MAVKKAERAATLYPLSFRATPELKADLEKSASDKGRSLTAEIQSRLERSFAWEAAHRDVQTMLAETMARIEKMETDSLEASMRRLGWKPVVGSPYWAKPGTFPNSKSGFIDPEKDEAPLLHRVEDLAQKPPDLEETMYRAVLRALRDARSQDLTPSQAPASPAEQTAWEPIAGPTPNPDVPTGDLGPRSE